jgi:glycosyltransferase involved in cell wall biosynthesis
VSDGRSTRVCGEDRNDDCIERWRELPHAIRGRVHLACVPLADADGNAAIVNALQPHASVVVQKILAEGFGLTVAEAMWKSRPIIASAVGGICDQVMDGEHGLLVEDPRDLPAFGAAVQRLLRDPHEARATAQQRSHARGIRVPRRPSPRAGRSMTAGSRRAATVNSASPMWASARGPGRHCCT